MTPLLKVLAPLVIVLGGFAGARWLNETAPQVPAQIPEIAVPLVEVLSVQSAPRRQHSTQHFEISRVVRSEHPSTHASSHVPSRLLPLLARAKVFVSLRIALQPRSWSRSDSASWLIST
jgi:hypothetical protein